MRIRSIIEEMNRYYDRRAIYHDRYLSYKSQADTENTQAELIKLIEPYVTQQAVLEIACGTGIWTEILALRADTVLAVDQSTKMLRIAKTRDFPRKNVKFRKSDAYSLKGIKGQYDTLFAADWWSHIPHGMIRPFLINLHAPLGRNKIAIFTDMTFRSFFAAEEVHFDSDGNRVSIRVLPVGQRFRVIKNFPDENDLRAALAEFAYDIRYFRLDKLERWLIIYRTM